MNFVEPIRSKEDIKKVEQYLAQKSLRNRLIFVFGINTGLRVSDILGLNVSDVLNKTHVEIREQKTNKYKKFPLNTKITGLLKTYLEDIINRLEKKIKDINENAHKIITNTNNIINTSDEILNSFIQTMRDKIERFDITIITKKIDKLDS